MKGLVSQLEKTQNFHFYLRMCEVLLHPDKTNTKVIEINKTMLTSSPSS